MTSVNLLKPNKKNLNLFLVLLLCLIGSYLTQHFLVTTRKPAQVVVPVGFILKLGLTDLCMECILMLSNGELMQHLLLF